MSVSFVVNGTDVTDHAGVASGIVNVDVPVGRGYGDGAAVTAWPAGLVERLVDGELDHAAPARGRHIEESFGDRFWKV